MSKAAVRIASAMALAALAVSPSAALAKPVELAPAQLSAVQNHSYSVPSNVAFNAVLSTLQTLGYMDVQADRDAGTVSAQTEAKAKTFYNIFWGFGKKKITQKASLLIEDLGNGRSTVRLNLQLAEMKARGPWGTSFSDGKMVRFAEPYNEFYAALDAEIARRAALTVK